MPPLKIDSNVTALAFAEEATLKTLPGGPVWYGLEPNSYTELGAAIQTVTREPIVAIRQKAKGTVTDVDAKGGFNTDLTQRNLTRFLQGFFFADALEKPATNAFNSAAVAITSIDATHYLAVAGLGVFLNGHLLFAKGMKNANNNGLKKVTGSAAGSVTIGAGLTVDATAQAGTLEAVGWEFAAGDLAATIVGATVVLTSTAIDFATLGLNVGEWIFVGGDAAGTQFALNAPFYARILAINGGATPSNIVLDLTSAAVVADAGAAKTIRIFFGKVLMNSPTVANIKRRTYQIEQQLGNDGGGIQSRILVGSVPNEITFNLQSNSKATADLTVVALDEIYRTGAQGILAGSRVASPFEDAFNTSHDIYSMFLRVIDPAGFNPANLFGFLTDLKLSIKNGVNTVKALGVVGGFEATAGDFDVSGTATAVFTSVAAVTSIRNNADVCLQAILAKKNSGMVFDVPLLQLGNGANKVEKDKPVITDLTQAASKNANNYTMSMTVFEYLPTVAVPA